jgi:predicted CoA-substrate-specific enzyme activase
MTNRRTGLSIGLDIGSISVNTVLLDPDGRILEERYAWCHGRPFHVLADEVAAVLERHPASSIDLVAATGTGGELAARLLGGVFVNEIVAQSAAVARLAPSARSVIEIGGEDAKLIRMNGAGRAGAASRLADFAMNTICAAGTGSFLDQQAVRLGLSIEREFGELALKSEDPPRIAGRCSVFAKSDMIHHQQIATPVADIVAGLCFAMARSIRSNLARGRPLEAPVVFQGGVAANAGMVRALAEVFQLSDGELLVPEHHASMGAIGAVFHVRGLSPAPDGTFTGIDRLRGYLADGGHGSNGHLEPLQPPAAALRKDVHPLPAGGPPLEVSLGVDVGSLSTNVVLIDRENHIVARRYLPTAGRPLEAIQCGLAEILEEVGDRVVVTAAGTTGSGRYLTGDFIGADTIRNEITAQATAAAFFEPDVDTIFEIGGQDSKFVSLDGGVVVDFEMNKVCAAGTGSFLEEQAEKLGISIVGEFADLALASKTPAKFGDRCTVFMESDLNAHQQRGTPTGDLVGGLAYSIVQNYLQKVVGAKRVGRKILFQGGVANNRAVVAAFAQVTGKPITVPPHFDVTGAIGAAMLAREECADGRASRFKGWGVSRVPYALDRFTCHGCANQCEIRSVTVEGAAKPLCYGGRCEKHEVEERRHRGRLVPDLFARRRELLLDGWTEEPADGRPSVGMARGLMMFWDQFPWWRTFFRELGARLVLSRPTDRTLVTRSLESLVAETCFPVEVMHGHVRDLFERDPDYVFLPFIVDAASTERGNPTCNYNCPWIEGYPFMVRAALEDEREGAKLLMPTLHFRYGRSLVEGELAEALAGPLGADRRRVRRAFAAAEEAQRAFRQAVRREGAAVLDSLGGAGRAVVLIGRPYNTGDSHLNLDLPGKLRELDVLPIPMDFLDLDTEDVLRDYDMMYWPNGQRILAGLRVVARDERLSAVYLSNFRCGPDSFLLHYAREEMRGKPWLHIEVDEHSAGAGIITRLEAFLDSLRAAERKRAASRPAGPLAAEGRAASLPAAPLPAAPLPAAPRGDAASRRTAGQGTVPPVRVVRARPSPGRSLYFPFMSDGAHVLAATARACGMDASVLPMQDARDLELGRRYTSSRECFPMICTTGSFLKKLEEPGVDPSRVSFFMPQHTGPCRFGQYHRMQRIILERIGCGEAQIVSPSNRTAYADFSPGPRFRLLVWRALVAVDLLGRMRQEHRQLERTEGAAEHIYRRSLDELVAAVECGGRDIVDVLQGAADAFATMPAGPAGRHPVVAIVGEIFMRDNPFCSGFLARRLEALGLETVMAPVREWIQASSIRYRRESAWRREPGGVVMGLVQGFIQNLISERMERRFHGAVNPRHIVPVERILDGAAPYVHRDYCGDPPLAFGAAAALAREGIAGVANILPFTCMPGTIVTSVAAAFRRDHGGIPWVDVAWDGQEDVGLKTRLEAFAHQVREFARVTSGGP